MNLIRHKKVLNTITSQNFRSMSFWKKFVPKFSQTEEKKPKPSKDEGMVVPSSQDEIRMKILQAEIDENTDVSLLIPLNPF